MSIDGYRQQTTLAIIIASICADICGADSWVEIQEYGKIKTEIFNLVISLHLKPPTILSHKIGFAIHVKTATFHECNRTVISF